MIKVQKMSGLSVQDFSDRVRAALRAAFPVPADCYGPYVDALFDDSVVFESERKLWRVAYTMDPATLAVSFAGLPEEVVRSYTAVSALAPGAGMGGGTPGGAAAPATQSATPLASAATEGAPAKKDDEGEPVDAAAKSSSLGAVAKAASGLAAALRLSKTQKAATTTPATTAAATTPAAAPTTTAPTPITKAAEPKEVIWEEDLAAVATKRSKAKQQGDKVAARARR